MLVPSWSAPYELTNQILPSQASTESQPYGLFHINKHKEQKHEQVCKNAGLMVENMKNFKKKNKIK